MPEEPLSISDEAAKLTADLKAMASRLADFSARRVSDNVDLALVAADGAKYALYAVNELNRVLSQK